MVEIYHRNYSVKSLWRDLIIYYLSCDSKYIEEPKAKISNEVDELCNSVEEKRSNLTLLLSQLVEKFTGKGMAIDYQFDNLEIDMTNATMLGGKKIGSIK